MKLETRWTFFIKRKFISWNRKLSVRAFAQCHARCALHKATWLRQWVGSEIQPTLQSSSCVPSYREAFTWRQTCFFPVHTEIQYGLESAPFLLQRHVRILNSIKLLSGFILKDQNWRDLFLAMMWETLIHILVTYCSFCLEILFLQISTWLLFLISLNLCSTLAFSWSLL